MPADRTTITQLKTIADTELLDLEGTLTAIDEWLNSDDIYFIDRYNNPVEDIRIVCKPFSIAARLITLMNTAG